MNTLNENVKQAKAYVASGQLSQEDFSTLKNIDPTPTKKYVGWMAKQWIKDNKEFTIHDLKNTIEEYNEFLNRGKAKTVDVYQFADFQALQAEVTELNNQDDNLSLSELESEYEVIIDNSDLYVVVPHTHEASRKLGLTNFAFRVKPDGTKDCAWCITFKSPDHFASYYYNQNQTIYMVLVRSEKLRQRIKSEIGGDLDAGAVLIGDNHTLTGIWNTQDQKLSDEDAKKFLNITGLKSEV